VCVVVCDRESSIRTRQGLSIECDGFQIAVLIDWIEYKNYLQSASSKIPINISHLGKAIPLQAWAGPEVSRRLRLPDFKTLGT
jgi:hypothetical protein